MQPDENQKGNITPNPTEDEAEKTLANLLRNPMGDKPEKKPDWPLRKEEGSEGRVPIKSLRTYQGDIDEAMSKNKYSATTILVAEQKRRIEKPLKVIKPANLEARNKLFVTVGIVLLFFGIITVVAVYYTRSNEQVVIEKQTKALIEFTKETKLDTGSITGPNLASRIAAETNNYKDPVNSVLFINTESSENTESVQKILSLLAPNMSSALLRSLDDKYMLGVIVYDTKAPFIILTVNDYPSAYAGMLKWEKNMAHDLKEMFSIEQNASTTDKTFIDEAIRNKDLRVLMGPKSDAVLVYSFIDKKTLVITRNENGFNAILAKFLSSQNTR